MKKIEKVMVNTFTTELATLFQAVLKSAETSAWENDRFLNATLSTLKEKVSLLTGAINRSKNISQLETIDRKRDQNIRSIYYLNKGYTYYHVTEVVEAAEQIDKILDKYSLKIIEESYAKESALIESLLKDLQTNENMSVVSKLPGLLEGVQSLESVQKEFVDNYVAYAEVKSQENEYVSATEMKKELLELFNTKLVVYLRAMQQAMPEQYGVFANSVAQLIEDNNAAVRRRK